MIGDDRIETNIDNGCTTNSGKLSNYLSNNLKKSLDLAKNISNRELLLDAKYFYDLGVAKYNSSTIKFSVYREEDDDDEASINKHIDEYKDECKEAIVYLIQAIKLNSNYMDAYLFRASIYHALEDYEEEGVEYIWRRIIDYEKIISICPKYFEAYFQLIEAYFQLADNIQRDEYFKEYIKYTQAYDRKIQTGAGYLPRKPDQEDFKYNSKYCNRVIEVYSNLVNVYPEYTEAYLQICRIKYYLEDYNGAIDVCNNLINIRPEYTEAYLEIYNIKCYLEDYSGAIDVCNRLASFDNKNINTYYLRANANCRSKNYARMLDDYNYLIDILGNGSISYYCSRAGINYYLKDYDGAMKDCDSAMVIDTDKSFAFQIYTIRNEIILSMGDLDGKKRSRPKVELSRFLWDIAPIKLTSFTRNCNNSH